MLCLKRKSVIDDLYFLLDGPQLDGRSLLESIISILTSDVWSSCTIIIKELSHLLINHVLCFHKYLNEVREQEWNGKNRFEIFINKIEKKSLAFFFFVLMKRFVQIIHVIVEIFDESIQ